MTTSQIRSITRQRQALSQAVSNGLAEVLRERMTIMNQVSRYSGVPRQTIVRILKRDCSPNLTTFIQVAAGLDMRASQLLALAEVQAGQT
jgi:DNA-binding phage protein